MYAPDPAAFNPAAPAKPRHAARNAGVQDHMPWSSQLWKVYPQINSMAGRFLRTSWVNRFPFCRTAVGTKVVRRVIQARSQPTRGPRQVRRNESLYPPNGRATPLMAREHAYPQEVLAIKYPTAIPRLWTAY